MHNEHDANLALAQHSSWTIGATFFQPAPVRAKPVRRGLMACIFAMVAALSACGGAAPEETCTIAPAAYVQDSDDIALTAPADGALGNVQLLAAGRAQAARLGIDPARVVVGPFAFCE